MNGEPFIPAQPQCPIEQSGARFTVSHDMFELLVTDAVFADSPDIPETAVGGAFYPENGWDKDTFVTTEIVNAPLGSELATRANDLHREVLQRANAHAGRLFCDRVRECRGVIDGDCWALGVKAVEEVIDEVWQDYRAS